MRHLRQGPLGSFEAEGWRPSPDVPRVYLKDLTAAEGWSMQLVRCEAGGSLVIGSSAAPCFLYVLDGELVHGDRRLWPGSAWVDAAGSAPVESHSDIGCTLLVFVAAAAPV